MVIYLFKGYVIFSFLKSRWSDDIEESIIVGRADYRNMDAALMRLAPYRPGT
jgi:hypothetical protein